MCSIRVAPHEEVHDVRELKRVIEQSTIRGVFNTHVAALAEAMNLTTEE